jgi:pimeloyl-ACP methyl ester carboxylesterase
LKIEKAAIVGHSMGGYVALAFAHKYPQRTTGLGLIASQARADTPDRKAGRYQEAADLVTHGANTLAAEMSVKLTNDPGLQAKLKRLILQQRPVGLAQALRAMAERLDSTPFLPEFNFPVAIVHGLEDKLVPVERAREVKEKVKRGTLSELEGAGHMPMMEAPQAVAGEIRQLVS